MKIKTLRRVEFVGTIATGAMAILVMQAAGWKWFLIWLPLLLLIELGCFAHRDIKWKLKENNPERHVCELCDGRRTR